MNSADEFFTYQLPADRIAQRPCVRGGSRLLAAACGNSQCRLRDLHFRDLPEILRAGDLLASWLAHDLIHIRQITRLHYRWLERLAAPYQLGYAGPF